MRGQSAYGRLPCYQSSEAFLPTKVNLQTETTLLSEAFLPSEATGYKYERLPDSIGGHHIFVRCYHPFFLRLHCLSLGPAAC